MLQLVQSSLWLQITIVLFWLGVVGMTADTLHRRTPAGPEIIRKVVHMGVGNVILLAWWLNIPAWLGVSASILFSAIALLSYRLPILPVINTVGRKSLGTFFYALSFAILIAWFWALQMPQYAAVGILIMTWGDGMAALVGQRFGRNLYKLWGMQKTWEGSCAMAMVSYGVSSGILWAVQGNVWQTWLVPVGIALGATTLEAFSKLGIDNLTVPVGSAAIAFWLNQLGPI
ncbi:MAG: phosphatidate cytidylyltransferase [Leptolyngbya sp. DLM2.Bin15]|nr:MAG: phosphatidate cytidylyltransferase [Leptolyngbya sp. DLM2.Bin15]